MKIKYRNILVKPETKFGGEFESWLSCHGISCDTIIGASHDEDPEFLGTIDGNEIRLVGFDQINAFVENYENTHHPIAA